jgi:hypothetical protein
VLDLIRKVLGGDANGNAKAEQTQFSAEKLKPRFAPIDEIESGQTRSGISKDILSYVLSGSPESVLGEIQKYKAVCAQIRVTGYLKSNASTYPVVLYPGFDDIPVDVLARWTRVLATAYSTLNARQWTLSLPGNVHEPEALLMHASGVNHSVHSNQKGALEHVTALGVEKLLIELGLPPSALLQAAFSMPAQRVWMFDHHAKMATDLIGPKPSSAITKCFGQLCFFLSRFLGCIHEG